jgi:hypothetical protein
MCSSVGVRIWHPSIGGATVSAMARRAKVIAAVAAGSLLFAVGVLGALWARSDAAPGQRLDASSLHPVAGNFEPDDTELAECGGDYRCLEQAFGNLAFREGPKSAIRVFDQKIASDAKIESNCHRIAHTIGSAALARFQGNVGEAFVNGSSSCWSGYYHGILERAFVGASTKSDVARVARGVCQGTEVRTTTWLAYQCVHGLGHGLMITSAYDLPFSLSVCDRLATSWDQVSCTGGVFMENISSSYGIKSRWLRDDNLVYPCNTVAERHKQYCYLMVTSRILEANGYDWTAAARLCNRVEPGWIDTCFESYGRDASGFTRQTPSKILPLCRLTGAHERQCVYAAARDMTANYGNGVRASTLCARAPENLRERCFYGIGTILETQEQGASCRRLSKRYAAACLSGTRERFES